MTYLIGAFLPKNISLELIVIVGVVAAVVLLVVFLLRPEKPKEILPYVPQPVLTNAELNFYRTLVQCIPRRATLLCKVRLADFLKVEDHDGSYLRYFGKISQKHADFLLVDGETTEPLLVIELDDSTHRRNQRTIESDAFKDRGYAAAGLPILRVKAARSYRRDEIATEIREAMAQDR